MPPEPGVAARPAPAEGVLVDPEDELEPLAHMGKTARTNIVTKRNTIRPNFNIEPPHI